MRFGRLSLHHEGALGIGHLVVSLFCRCINFCKERKLCSRWHWLRCRWNGILEMWWMYSHSYLLYSSSLPSHVKNSIPYSPFLRFRRLCSDDSDFSSESEEMWKFFNKRGYPASVVQAGHNHAQQIDRREHYKRHKERTREFHSLSHFTLTTTQWNQSF